MDPFVHQCVNDGCAWIIYAVCFFSCLFTSPPCFIGFLESFFVHLHYFKTSATLRFKLCVRDLKFCREISKQISHLNNSVGNAVEGCSFMKMLIAFLKFWNPKPLQLPSLAIFSQTILFAICISLGTCYKSSWDEEPHMDKSGCSFYVSMLSLSLWIPVAVAQTLLPSLRPPYPDSALVPSCWSSALMCHYDPQLCLLPPDSPSFLPGSADEVFLPWVWPLCFLLLTHIPVKSFP